MEKKAMESQTLEQEKDIATPETGANEPVVRKAMPRPRSSSKKWVILAIFLAVAAAAVYFWVHSLNRVTTDDAEVDGHIVPVSSKIYGKVAEVLIDDNQQVKKGQVLVRIDPRDYEVKLDQANAALGVAESQAKGADVGVPLIRETTTSDVSGAEAQLSGAQADYERARVDYQRANTAEIAVARSNVAAAQATADRAAADLDRMKSLVDKDEISRLEYDAYVSGAKVANSDLQAAKDKLSAATQDAGTKRAAMLAAQAHIAQAKAAIAQARAGQKQVNVREADASSAAANIGQARANLEAAQLNLSYTTIVAPMDGVVTRKSVEWDEIVQQGQGLHGFGSSSGRVGDGEFQRDATGRRACRPASRSQGGPQRQNVLGACGFDRGRTGARMSLLPPENATGNYVKVVERIPVKIVLDPIPGGNQVLRPGMNVEATIFTR